MVSSLRDSHLAGGAVAERAAGVFHAFRPCRSGRGSRLLSDPHAAAHRDRGLVILRGFGFRRARDHPVTLDSADGHGDFVVSRPPFCVAPWVLQAATSIFSPVWHQTVGPTSG